MRGDRERVVRAPPTTASLRSVRGELFGLVRGGASVHTVDADDCRYCDFGGCPPSASRSLTADLRGAG